MLRDIDGQRAPITDSSMTTAARMQPWSAFGEMRANDISQADFCAKKDRRPRLSFRSTCEPATWESFDMSQALTSFTSRNKPLAGN